MKLPRVYLPIAVAVSSYAVTTGIGTAIISLSFGQEQLSIYLGEQPSVFTSPTFGSLSYWWLLFLFPIAVPACALLCNRASGFRVSMSVEPPMWSTMLIAGIFVAFCAWHLALADALDVRALWDSRACYEAKILRRVELQHLLGNAYFGFAFASLPLLACHILVRAFVSRRVLELAIFFIVLVAVVWLQLATLQKAPLMVFAIMLLVTLALSGVGIVRSVAIVGLPAVALFAGLSLIQFCAKDPMRQQGKTIGHASEAQGPNETQSTASTEEAAGTEALVTRLGRNALFRMSVGFPYYIDIFSNRDQRCGIDPSWLYRFVGPQHCFPPTKVFPKIFPKVTYTTGYQPAPVNVAAYAEAGPWYAILATLIAGAIIGLLSSFDKDSTALATITTVAACIFAYYVSQASLTGALFDSYGLMWLALPIVLLAATASAHGHLFHSPESEGKGVPT